MIKVVIADDQELIRESLKIVLDQNEDIEVTGVAENGQILMDMLKGGQPDVILMDVRMPELDGVEATREVKQLYPAVKIIILNKLKSTAQVALIDDITVSTTTIQDGLPVRVNGLLFCDIDSLHPSVSFF